VRNLGHNSVTSKFSLGCGAHSRSTLLTVSSVELRQAVIGGLDQASGHGE